MLTENDYKILEDATGIQGLQGMVESSEPANLVPKKTKHFDEVSYNVMYDNLTKQGLTKEKYEEAKQAGVEMEVKEIKRAKGYEFEGKSVSALVDYLEKQIQIKSTTEISEKEKEFLKDIEALKKQIQVERTEKENLALQRKNDKIYGFIDNEFNQIQIDIPPHIKDAEKIEQFKKIEIEKNKVFFKSLYNFDLEGEKIIPKDINGNTIKDELQSPKDLSVLIKDFAKANIINLAQPRNGRGDGDKFPVNNDLSNVKSIDDLYAYADKKGIKPNTKEFDAIYMEYDKNNKT